MIRIFDYIILAVLLIIYVGIFPRDLQYNAPSVFMLGGCVITFIYMKGIQRFTE
jgi:hypothetical protein